MFTHRVCIQSSSFLPHGGWFLFFLVWINKTQKEQKQHPSTRLGAVSRLRWLNNARSEERTFFSQSLVAQRSLDQASAKSKKRELVSTQQTLLFRLDGKTSYKSLNGFCQPISKFSFQFRKHSRPRARSFPPLSFVVVVGICGFLHVLQHTSVLHTQPQTNLPLLQKNREKKTKRQKGPHPSSKIAWKATTQTHRKKDKER